MEKLSCRERKQVELLHNDPTLRYIFEDLAMEKVQTPEEISNRRCLPVSEVKTAIKTLVDAELVSPILRTVYGSVFYSLSRDGLKLETMSKRYKDEDCGNYYRI